MTKLTREALMDWFGEGYAGFYGKDGDYTDVVIDGHYDLAALEKLIDDATAKAVVAASDELEAQEARIRDLEEALDRQCDNMAFTLNRVDLHAWHGRFSDDLEADRLTLSKAPSIK